MALVGCPSQPCATEPGNFNLTYAERTEVTLHELALHLRTLVLSNSYRGR